MQIPEEYRKFQSPTLVVVSDNTQAILYKGDEDQFEQVDIVTQDYFPYDDASKNMRPRTSGNQGQQRADAGQSVNAFSSEQSENIKQVTREHLYTNLNKELMHRMQENEFETLIITAPQEDVNNIKEALHTDLQKRITIIVPKILTKEEPLAIVKHVEQALFPEE